MITRILSLMLLLPSLGVVAQTPGPGSIAFTGFQTNAPDGFAFVCIQDIPANTTIYFTDNGWDGTALFANEQTLSWNSGNSTVTAGSWVYIYDDQVADGLSPHDGPGTVSGELPNLSASGEQILAYTGSESNPSFIAAISNSNYLSSCSPAGTPDNNNTCLPFPLVQGISAQAPVNSSAVTSNMYFAQSTYSGNPTDFLALLMTPSNWIISSDITVAGAGAWPTWNFNLTAAQPLSVSFQSSSLQLTEGQAVQYVTIQTSAPVLQNQTLELSLSGVLQPSDIQTEPAFSGSAIPVTIEAGTNAATVSITAIADGSTEGTETGTLTLTNLSSGLMLGSPSTLSITVSEAANVALVNFNTASLMFEEGEGPADVLLDLSIPAPSAADVQVQVIYGIRLETGEVLFNPAPVGNLITLSVPQGAQQVSVAFSVLEDVFPEGTETLQLQIASVGNGLVIGQQNAMEISIPENDQDLIPTGVYLNEVMASNFASMTDENGMHSDWIELFHSGPTINLAGLYLTDNVNEPLKYRIPEGSTFTEMGNGSFKVFWADDSTAAGPLHTNFKISASGEFIGLYADADIPVLIDSVYVPALQADQSWGRAIDGTGNWMVFEAGFTTGQLSNMTTGIGHPTPLAMQVYPNPFSTSLWMRTPLTETASIRLCNALGQCVWNTEGAVGMQSLTVPANLPSGWYLLQVSTSTSTVQIPLIKQ